MNDNAPPELSSQQRAQLGVEQALAGLGLQLVWVVITGAAAAILWRRGLRVYGAFGA